MLALFAIALISSMGRKLLSISTGNANQSALRTIKSPAQAKSLLMKSLISTEENILEKRFPLISKYVSLLAPLPQQPPDV